MSNNVLLVKCFDCGAGGVNPNSIVKMGSADYQVVQADGPTAAAKLVGISLEVASASGDRIDVALSGIADLKLGGTVARGDPITSDANGNGVTAAPSAGVNNRIIGIAVISGVSGDIIPLAITQGFAQG